VEAECDNLAAAVARELRTRVPHNGEDVFFNTTSHSRRFFLADYPRRIDPGSCTRILTCDGDLTSSQCVIEVPPFGFAKVASQTPSEPRPNEGGQVTEGRVHRPGLLGRIFGSRTAVALDDGSMANEFMEVQIDPAKGHLRSLYVVNKRGNRLSGQLSWSTHPLQLRNPYHEDSFLAISDVRLRVIHSSKVRGSIQVTGKLGPGSVDIRYTLWHGAQWLDIEMQGDGLESQNGFPVWRMVWPSEAASIAAWSQGAKGKLPSPLQCAVELIEIDDAEHRIHFATGGLSMHRRVGPNGLASAIPVDRSGSFAIGFSVGIDWMNPWATAIDRMVPNMVSIAEGIERPSPRKSSDTGAWLARCNVSNLHFRWIDPQPPLGLSTPGQQEHTECDEGILADGCVWMVEMAGKAGTAKLGCVRPIERAWRVDFRGLEYDKLKVQDGEALVPYQAWERFRIAVCFKR
jgi:hypothetical protein